MKRTFLVTFMALILGITGNMLVVAQTPSICDSNPELTICPELEKGKNQTPTDNIVINTIKKVINIVSYVIGVASLVMIVVGAMKYIVSSGDSQRISSAKNTIAYSLVGLVIAIMAQAIVKFVLVRL